MLAEFNTHRVFSRNSASSRAIPTHKRLQDLRENIAWPEEWPSEQAGMQGGEPLDPDEEADARILWDQLALHTAEMIEQYVEAHPEPERRLHKSLLNRLMEPWLWHTIVVTSTEWDNFFRQRCSPLAQPEIRLMAEAMRGAMEESTPAGIGDGEWHLPYTELREVVEIPNHMTIQGISAARCARVSYLTQEGTRDFEKDWELYQRLCNPGDGPPHASPLEHIATPGWVANIRGNFRGWHQLRHEVLGF